MCCLCIQFTHENTWERTILHLVKKKYCLVACTAKKASYAPDVPYITYKIHPHITYTICALYNLHLLVIYRKLLTICVSHMNRPPLFPLMSWILRNHWISCITPYTIIVCGLHKSIYFCIYLNLSGRCDILNIN